MIRALANIINSPVKKKRVNVKQSNNEKVPKKLKLEQPTSLSHHNELGLGNQCTLKNPVPLIPINGSRMKIVESVMVYELWNWYQQNVDNATQSTFTNWCGLGIGVPGMSKKLRNPKYRSSKTLEPELFWYSTCGHRQKIELHLTHKKNHPEVADRLCGDCCGTTMAMARDKLCNEALRDCLDLQSGLWKHKWPNKVIEINVGSVIDRNLQHLVDKSLWEFLNSSFEFQIVRKQLIHLHRYDAPKVDIVGPTANVAGATFPTDFCPGNNEVMENLNDGSFGLVVFPTDDPSQPDFLFIGDSGLSNECIRNVSAMETSHIMRQKTEKRAGPATGQFIPIFEDYSYDPKALSNATRNDRVYRLNPAGDTTILKLDYWSNHSDRPKHARVISKDIVMHRLTNRAKRALAERNGFYRQKLLAKMNNNFLAIVSIGHQALYSDKKMDELWQVFVKALTDASNENCQTKWKRFDPKLTFWDIVLLEWNCHYGEDITHQATKFHTDGKGPETYSIWGKVAMNETGNDKDIVDAMTPGLLVFPHHGMFMRVRCGRDAVTMSLKETMHGGDCSRGRRNFSSVDWNGRR